METVKRSVVLTRRGGEGREKSGGHRGFQSSENTMHGVILVGTYHHTFVQTHPSTTPRLWALSDYDVSMQVHPWFKKKKVPFW